MGKDRGGGKMERLRVGEGEMVKGGGKGALVRVKERGRSGGEVGKSENRGVGWVTKKGEGLGMGKGMNG